MIDQWARGGVRRYQDTVPPEEYIPQTGEVDLTELSLTGLSDLFGSDKSFKHKYTPVYADLVEQICVAKQVSRKDAQLDVAEAGVACGASLNMWSHYLPKSRIVGYDVRKQCASLCKNLANVEIVIGDPAAMKRPHRNSYDIFVDDASHISEQIVSMFKNCWPWVTSGGYYIIEDLRCTYNPEYTEQFRRHFDPKVVNDRGAFISFLDTLLKIVDSRGDAAEIHYYPELMIIRKQP
jgi:hypothetical protein